MRIVIAPDSFKESLTAPQAAAALEAGVRSVDPTIDCDLMPLSDGGEGFLNALTSTLDATLVPVRVAGPLGDELDASFGLVELAGQKRSPTKTAIIEVAAASGLECLSAKRRNIMRANTRGVGQLIRASLDAGASELIVGLGGSATNDGGAGMLAEVGVRFLDANGDQLQPIPVELAKCAAIDVRDLDPRLARISVRAACDVQNELLGKQGAAAVYGPQKGADSADVARLDDMLAALTHARVIGGADWSIGDLRMHAHKAGAGAAGGLGWALAAFFNAEFTPGVQLVCEAVQLQEAIAKVDAVFTGEGAIDAQSAMGKTLSGVAAIARDHDVPVIAFGAMIAPEADALYDTGVSALIPIVRRVCTREEALAEAEENLIAAARIVTRLLRMRI